MAADPPGAVLFACTMNAVRSPMAAAMLRHLAGPRMRVHSGGVRAGEPDGFAIAVMREIGIDMADHRPRALAELDEQSYDLIVTLSPEAHHQALEMTRTMPAEVEFWPTHDATVLLGQGTRQQMLRSYRQVRDGLFARIKQRFMMEAGPSV